MAKWRHGRKIDRWATKQLAVLFNLQQEFYPAQQPSSTRNSLSQLFTQFCIIPGQQMSTLWANGDSDLISTAGQQSSVQYSLTSNEEFYPAQPSSSTKNSLSQLFSKFCIIPGQQMSTLWRNGDRGYN